VQTEVRAIDAAVADGLAQLHHRQTELAAPLEDAAQQRRCRREVRRGGRDLLEDLDRLVELPLALIDLARAQQRARSHQRVRMAVRVAGLEPRLGGLLVATDLLVVRRGAAGVAADPVHVGRLRAIAGPLVGLSRAREVLELPVRVPRREPLARQLEVVSGFVVGAAAAVVLAEDARRLLLLAILLEHLGGPHRLAPVQEELRGLCETAAPERDLGGRCGAASLL
jgi:hypothetical protein